MDRINISNIISDYRNQRDIETALAWSALRQILIDHSKGELFLYVENIKISEKYITIKTLKPIVHESLLFVLPILSEKLKDFGIREKKIRIH